MAARPGAARHRRRRVGAARGRAGPAGRAAQRDPRRPVRRAARCSRDGLLPAAVVLRPRRLHPGRRPRRRRATRGRWCSRRPTSAATPTGQWRVLADRAQAPSGIGYAMENRRVVSRVLPELYREAGLHRMEPYFWALRSALLQSAQGDLADPRVVVLSPGTHSETAYDQAFVASALGFPLVQGSDLRGPRRLGAGCGRPAVGPRAGRRDPAPGRRRVERPARAARRLPARRGRPGRGGTPRPGARSSTGSAPACSRTPGCCPTCRPSARRCSASRCGCESVPTWWCGDPRLARAGARPARRPPGADDRRPVGLARPGSTRGAS